MPSLLGRSACVLAGLALLVVLPAQAGPGLALAPGDPAPAMRGDLMTGQREVLDYSTSKLTLINFWATWCEPCLLEMPALEALHQKHSGEGLRIVGVLRDRTAPDELNLFLERVGISYDVLRPLPRYRSTWGGIASLPTSFLIDDGGTVLRRYVGATPEQVEGMIFDIEERLAGRSLGPFVMSADPNAVTDEDRLLRLKQQQTEGR